MTISQPIEENVNINSTKIELMGLKFRLTLLPEHKKIIDQTLGNSRFVYNYGLKQALDYWERNKKLEKKDREPIIKSSDLSAQLTQLKKELWVIDKYKIETLPEYENIDWLKITGEQFNNLPKIYWLEHNCLSTALQQSLKHMDNARQRFFKGHSGFPRFKKKSHGSSCTITPNNMNCVFKDKNKRIDYLTKSKNLKNAAMESNVQISGHALIKEKLSQDINEYDLILSKTSKPLKIHFDGRSFKACDIKSINISKTPTGKYFITFLVPVLNSNLNQTILTTHNQILQLGDTVGIDMGIKTTATLCSKITNVILEKRLKGLEKQNKRIKRQQKILSRKKKGSNNFHKQRVKVAKTHEDLTNYRNNFYQELSTEIFKQYHTVVIEDLHIKGMVKNKRLAKHISMQAWAIFFNMLMYKANLYDKEIIVADRFFPSSKICSACSHYNCYYGQLDKPLNKNGKKNMQIPNNWTCSNCNTVHQRDENAAKNLANYVNLKDTYKELMKKSLAKDVKDSIEQMELYQITNGVNVKINKKNSTAEFAESGTSKTVQMSTAELLRPKLNINIDVNINSRQNSNTKRKSLVHGETDTLGFN